MKILPLILSLCLSTTVIAETWYQVEVIDGEPIVTQFSGHKSGVKLKGETFPSDTVFPAVDPRYWKKQGKNWVEMNQSQKNKVDSAAKAEIVDEVNTDASLDALIKVIADLNNLSEKQVKDRMLSKVDKDKAHKAKKNRGN
jgi:hypothetical protein